MTSKLKNKARKKTRMAIQAGKLVRPSACPKCGAVGDVHAHHPDYSKPLDVEWLCPPCHRAVHRAQPWKMPPEVRYFINGKRVSARFALAQRKKES